MKLRYLWKITLDNEWKQGIRSFFNVILYIVGITIIGLLVYFVSLETDTKKSVERSIRKEIKTLKKLRIPCFHSLSNVIFHKYLSFIYRSIIPSARLIRRNFIIMMKIDI